MGFTQGSTVRADIEFIGEEVWSGHDEQALEYSEDLDSKAHERSSETTQSYFEQNSLVSTAWLSSLVGDLKTSGTQWLRVAKTPEYLGLARLSHGLAATAFALDHDPEAARQGDADGALSELQHAHETGPLFADALELMGEALMRKGDYHGAVDKFRSADEAALHWGRNHLRWGESLLRMGREREAKAQLETARRLNLDGSDRAELDALLARAAAAVS